MHAGDIVGREWFKDRESSKDYKGYDLICGGKRNHAGDIDTFAENELLQINREEQ